MDPRILALFDAYTHQPLTRSEFLARLAKLAGGTAAALALLPLLEVNYAHARTVHEAHAGIRTCRVTYRAGTDEVQAYLAEPEAGGPYGAVIVIHENRGLNPHIEDVARRVAEAGFIGLAPDALSLTGGTPADADAAREAIRTLEPVRTRSHFEAALPYLRSLPTANGQVGCVGFCWGGAMANQLAVHVPDLAAAVAFYGRQPDLAEVPAIKAAVQLHYAGLDERINAGMEAYDAALAQAGVRYETYLYPEVNHAFHNDTAGARYDATSAALAWERTLAFFRRYLV